MKKVTTMLIIAVLAFSSVLFAAERRNPRKEIQPMLARLGEKAEVVSALRARAGNVRTLSKASGGFVAPDTFHTAGTTYDYGWNALTKQYIITDALGFQHIAFMRRTTLDNAATRRIYYQWEVDDVPPTQVGVNVTPLGQGSGWPSIDVTSDGRAVIINHTGLVKRYHVDQAAGFGLFASNPHPMDPAANPVYPSLVVDQSIDRGYWWSTGTAYTAFGDSQAVYFTDDEGVSWDSTALAWDYTGTSSYWAGSAIAISHDNSSMAVWQRFDDAPNMTGDTTDIIVYSRTDDGGATWTQTIPVWVNLDPSGAADDIVTPFGYNDTLTTHPIWGMDLGFDNANNVHMVMSAEAYHAINDSESVTTSGILHYSSARGEGAGNLIEITDQAISHSAVVDSAIGGPWPGLQLAYYHPTIATAADEPALLVMWGQWKGLEGGTMASILADTGATGFYTGAIWAASSADGGNNWSDPWVVASLPGIDLTFVTLDPVLETVDAAAGLYRYNALWHEDLSPGNLVRGEGDSSMNVWIHATEEITILPIIGVEDEDVFSAKSFKLNQNYPNPFNPATRIDFTLDTKSEVNLTIFNMLGQEVATLVNNEVIAAGNHNVTWNASDVASGVYFYKLTAGDLTLTKKMVLLK